MKKINLNLNIRKIGLSRKASFKVISVILILSVSLQSNAQFLGTIAFAQENTEGTESAGLKDLYGEHFDKISEDVVIDINEQEVNSAQLKRKAFVKTLEKKNYKAGEHVKIVIESGENIFVKVTIKNPKGEKVAAEVQQSTIDEQKILDIVPPQEFEPGAYTVQINSENGEVNSTLSFLWGVLALNPNKSVYNSSEEADIAIAVLDEKGKMVCDASVILTVTTPKGEKAELSTENGEITVNNQCTSKEFSLTPDYETSYKASEEGEYLLNLRAETKNGKYSINDKFEVNNNSKFEIERISATRIYPPHIYPMTIKIKANEDFKGTFSDVVPASFELYESSSSASFDNVRTVTTAAVKDKNVLGVQAKLSFPFENKTSTESSQLNSYVLTSVFGDVLRDPLLKQKYAEFGLDGHDGIDFDMPVGTPVLATDKGTVVLAQEDSDYGTTIVIEHEWGKSYYGHLSKISVAEGEMIARGGAIGLSGNTGLSTGPHLHFGVKPNSAQMDNGYYGKVDPAPYLGLPDESSVLGATAVADLKVKVVSFEIDIKKGETKEFLYHYKTPPQSPQFYTMGPLRFIKNDQEVYSENRQWQLAVDAYAGSQVKTVEFILGGGTDTSTRATTNLVYAGASFNTVKATAGTVGIVIPGTNVSVRSAYVESRFVIQTAADVTDIDMMLDATPGPNSGADTRISPVLQNGGSRWDSSGPSGWMIVRGDVTSQLSTQSDSEWGAGVDVVAATSVTGPSFAALTTKLVITYESDYSTSSHTELKTVRFPLDSTVSGDTGSTRAACAASTTCSFSYNANIPDLLSDDTANIESVFFEIHAMSDSATAPSITPQINGGSAGSAVSEQEVIADVRDLYVLYKPPVGGSDFLDNTSQTLDIVNGGVGLNVLGGELIVTYQYSTGAATQTETIRYWAEQDTAENGVTKTSFPGGASNITISNSGFSVTNIWYKVRTAPSAAQTFTVFGKVGGATEASNAYTLTGTNARAGEAVIIYDMSADASSFSSSTTKVAGASQFSSATGDSEVSAELFVTFTWSGSGGGAQTKTVLFNVGTSPVSSAVATEYHNFNSRIFIPETVTKTHRSSYIDATHSHSDATAIQNTANTIYLNGGSIMALTPQDDLEAFSRTYAASISAEMFTHDYTSSYKTIGFTRRSLGISHTIGVAEELAASDVFVLTYDADFSQDGTAENPKSLRTVEYILGGGTDISSRTTATNVYAGSSWNTTKGSAGTVPVEIPGSGIAVRGAFLEARISVSNAVNTTDIDMLFDATPGPNSGTDGRVSPVIQGTYAETSGQGYWMLVRANVGSQLSVQTDSDWNNGVDVVAGLSTTGPTTQLNSMKLVITYEQDYSETAHDELKTVRFPLDSTVSGDTGSYRGACAASATCSFGYNANIPDLLSGSNANIESAFFELHAVSDSATAPSFTPQINGGTAGVSHSDGEILADVRDMYVLYQPIVGGSDFLPNTAQTLDIVNGSVGLNTLGGELIVTYKFNTGASSQTETVRYFAEQDTAENGVTKTSFTRSSFNISNSGFSVSNLWFKVRTSHAAAQTFTVFGNVGGAGEKSNAYTLTGTNPRGGETVIIYDMTADAASFSSSPTTVAGASQFSSATGDSEVNAELFITFTWTGTNLGTQTKTVFYNGGTSGGATRVASEYHNLPVFVFLPETVTKTHRSTYVESINTVGDATSISSGTRTLALNGINSTVMAPQDDVEGFSMTLLQEISSTNFSGGSTIGFQRRAFTLTDTYNQADRYFFSNLFVITYDAQFAASGGGPETPTLDKLMRHGLWFNSTGVKQPFTF